MNGYRYLNIKGTNLENGQLEKYLKQVAEEHVIGRGVDKNTFPISRLKKNFNNILRTYQLLNEHLKLGLRVHSAGEWLLDNFYVVEETVKNIERTLTVKDYSRFPGIASGKYRGFARVYVLASEIVAFSDEVITEEKIINAINSYQTRKVLSMEEIWNIGIFIQIAIIQKISDICDKIYYSQIQKYKVENIYERLVEIKPNGERVFKEKIRNNSQITDLNYSFIEYMVYKLRRIGKRGNPYIEVLENQVNKLGTSIDDIVQKEHLYVATLKIQIGVNITTIKAINRISFKRIFEKTNKTEELLCSDPSGFFAIQTDDTKENYRNIIKKLSDKTKVSEIYITEQVLKLATRYKGSKDLQDIKKSHVGYYLIDEGWYELKEKILERKVKRKSAKKTQILYIWASFIIPFVLDFLFVGIINFSYGWKIILFLLCYMPIFEISIKTINYVLSKCKKSIAIPKVNFENGVSEDAKTIVTMPTILDSCDKVKECFKKIEVYYLANQDENIYFSLLGDCTTSEKEVENFDKDVANCGFEEAKRLNEKYGEKNRFNFLYRKRRWNPREGKYLGWERKRGLLTQFNDVLLNQGSGDFIVNTLEKFDEKIKYVITLDSDTNLILDSAQKMIGAMYHILNRPVINGGAVIDGYGIMQPRVGISLEDSQKSMFTKIFSGNPGIDFYTNSIFDVYQDYFKEGIFTGKGIYDLEIYQKLLKDKLPENRILSHDLLEGNYLRCAQISDVVVLDSFPIQHTSYLERENRWIRGDWQIAAWMEKKIKNRKNPINSISKYKIFDNLRRSVLPIFELILLIIAIAQKSVLILFIVTIALFISSTLEIVNKIIFRKSITEEKIYAHKQFYRNISGIRGTVLRNGIEISVLPTIALNSFLAIVKTLYRLRVNKNLLEWKTSDQVDKSAKNTLEYYCQKMFFNIIIGIIMFGFMNPLGMVLGTLWILGPFISWRISQSIKIDTNIPKENKAYLKNLAQETWNYFYESFQKENNYLVPDNYQQGRKNKFVSRTSSTNIGLELMSIMSASDLGFISVLQAIEMIEKLIDTVMLLPKWNGHLYNWYNIKNLEPLKPEYVSTVDSGNFVGYLFVLKTYLLNNKANKELTEKVEKLINDTDFKYLYSEKNRLFSIGFDIAGNRLSDSYYDFLASEARQTSFVAIAKKDVKYKHWINLSRTLTSINGYKGLISWSGTAFEYTMPNLIVNVPKGSLMDEACKFAKVSQVQYAQRNNIPWGISESAYSLKDLQGNYQYKAFGIPWLGLKRGLEQELVVSPYGTILFLEYGISDVIQNLKRFESLNMRGKYGFYDSVDFTSERVGRTGFIPVKTYMAHHQGLILNSINNVLSDDILRKRFMQNPEIQSVKVLLNERMPESVILSKETRNKVNKGRLAYSFDDKDIIYKSKEKFRRLNSISSDKYTNVYDNEGRGYSKVEDIQINRYRNRIDIPEGVGVYFKNLQTKKIWSSFKSDKIVFSQSKNEFIKREENIETDIKVFLSPEQQAEIRQIDIKNYGVLKNNLEIYMCFEPLLSRAQDDIAHPAYNNMFLKFDYLRDKGILLCSRKINEQEVYLGVKVIQKENREVEFELDREKFVGRNTHIPAAIADSRTLTNEVIETVEPIIALKTTIDIEPDEEYKISFIMQFSDDKSEIINYLDELTLERQENILELAKAKSDEEIRFLGVNGEKIENNQILLGHLLERDLPKTTDVSFSIEDVWKFGISGDNPIILAEIRNLDEVYLIEELLDTIEFFNVKNIRIDLCVLNNEKVSYETFVKDEIIEAIRNHRLEYLIANQIFILNKKELTNDDIEVLESVSTIKMYGNIGGIKNNLEELENITKNKDKRDIYQLAEAKEIEDEPKKYDNGYGGFTDNEYIININKNNIPPRVWSNVMANKEFGTVTTDNYGGYTWLENSRLKRITSWENDPIEDFQSEQILVKDLDKKLYWSLGSNPQENSYQVRYGMGYSKYIQANDDFIQENTVFVPINEKLKINHISIKNKDKNKRRLILYYALNLSMGEERQKNLGKIRAVKNNNCVEISNICKSYFAETIEVTSSEKLSGFSNNIKDFFDDQMNPQNGIGLKNIKNTGNIVIGNEVVIEIPIEIDAFERKEVNILMGVNAKDFMELEKVHRLYEDVEKYWQSKTEVVKVNTPSEKLNLYMNKWLIYQTISSRINAKAGFYQSGGAIGFRDQLQDSLGMKWVDINFLRYQILQAASHQFIEGDVMHWWHNENQTGIRTKMSDDLLWLPYSVLEYIEFTEDYDILDLESVYSCGIEILDEKDKYDKYDYTKETETIYQHCIRAIEKSLKFGKNGFPKIGTGDWNDGFSKIGHKGVGESIWLGFFLYDILNRWEKILEYKNDFARKDRYNMIKNNLKKSLNTSGWDGMWYKRAINDDGKTIGSSESLECKIDSISQSWSVISDAGSNDKKYIAIESAKKYLVDEENQIIKLLTPPFSGEGIDPGYIKKYPDGVRENGGQYTHSSVWLIMAMSMLGMIDEALRLIEMINPISHSENRISAQKYKIEPYSIPGDIYSNKYMQGRGGWSWYTGSSSWYYKVCLENILGLKRVGKKLFLPKNIPSLWDKFEIQYRFNSNLYNIKVYKNDENSEKRIVLLNGMEVNEEYIELKDENKIENIEIKI